MSIVGMTTSSIQIEPLPDRDVVAASAPQKKAPSALNQIVKYIPSEVIAIYLAGFGIFQPQATAFKLVIFAVALLFIPFLIFYSQWKTKKENKEIANVELSRRNWIILSLMAITSYCVWVAAIPQSWYADLFKDANQFGSWFALILAIALPRIGEFLGVGKN